MNLANLLSGSDWNNLTRNHPSYATDWHITVTYRHTFTKLKIELMKVGACMDVWTLVSRPSTPPPISLSLILSPFAIPSSSSFCFALTKYLFCKKMIQPLWKTLFPKPISQDLTSFQTLFIHWHCENLWSKWPLTCGDIVHHSWNHWIGPALWTHRRHIKAPAIPG